MGTRARAWVVCVLLGAVAPACQNEGIDYCTEVPNKMRECGAVSEGWLPCPTGEDGYDIDCAAQCYRDATCENILQFVCMEIVFSEEDLKNPLANCIYSCLEKITCDDGETVPLAFKCDGEDDCEDGSDEDGCTWFTCDDGETVPLAFKCDGEDDCEDGLDEVGCPSITCDDGETVPLAFKCDDKEDCEDGSDEMGCARPLCEQGTDEIGFLPTWDCSCTVGSSWCFDTTICDGSPVGSDVTAVALEQCSPIPPESGREGDGDSCSDCRCMPRAVGTPDTRDCDDLTGWHYKNDDECTNW